MAIDDSMMNDTVVVTLLGRIVNFKWLGVMRQGFVLKRHMRVQFNNGEEVMVPGQLNDLADFHDTSQTAHGAIIVQLETETEPTENTVNPDNSFQNRADVHNDESNL